MKKIEELKEPTALDHYVNLRDHVIGLDNMIKWSEEHKTPEKKLISMRETLNYMKRTLLATEELLKQDGIEIPNLKDTEGIKSV